MKNINIYILSIILTNVLSAQVLAEDNSKEKIAMSSELICALEANHKILLEGIPISKSIEIAVNYCMGKGSVYEKIVPEMYKYNTGKDLEESEKEKIINEKVALNTDMFKKGFLECITLMSKSNIYNSVSLHGKAIMCSDNMLNSVTIDE